MEVVKKWFFGLKSKQIIESSFIVLIFYCVIYKISYYFYIYISWVSVIFHQYCLE